MTVRNNVHPCLTLAYWLSGLLVAATFVHGVIGALFPGIFRDPASTAGNAQGTAIVIVTIAIPVLVISMIRAAQGSYRAQIVWLGTLGYILYNAVIFTFGVAFNPLFLLYVASLSLSLWAIVALLVRVDVDEIRARFASNLPVRFFAIMWWSLRRFSSSRGCARSSQRCSSPRSQPFFMERTCLLTQSMCWI